MHMKLEVDAAKNMIAEAKQELLKSTELQRDSSDGYVKGLEDNLARVQGDLSAIQDFCNGEMHNFNAKITRLAAQFDKELASRDKNFATFTSNS